MPKYEQWLLIGVKVRNNIKLSINLQEDIQGITYLKKQICMCFSLVKN